MSVSEDDYWYRLYFKLRLYEADGLAFQHLVSDILHARHQDFQAVRPAGSLGDGGNDGYVPSEQHYFQVYGPSPGSHNTPARLVGKAKADFVKLRASYPHMQGYSFVLNDHFRGVPRDVLDALNDLQRSTGIPCDCVASRHLMDWFMALDAGQRQRVLQGVPVAAPEWIDPRAIADVLEHLALRDAGHGDPSRRIAPDFDEKIRFNGLDGFAGHKLSSASYQVGSVDAFFAARDAHLSQVVAKELRRLYTDATQKVSDGEADAPALRYLWIIERMLPPQVHNDVPVVLKAYRQAAEVVLAKYFEACDVYEKP